MSASGDACPVLSSLSSLVVDIKRLWKCTELQNKEYICSINLSFLNSDHLSGWSGSQSRANYTRGRCYVTPTVKKWPQPSFCCLWGHVCRYVIVPQSTFSSCFPESKMPFSIWTANVIFKLHNMMFTQWIGVQIEKSKSVSRSVAVWTTGHPFINVHLILSDFKDLCRNI